MENIILGSYETLYALHSGYILYVSNKIVVPEMGILSNILAMFSNIVNFGWDERVYSTYIIGADLIPMKT